MAAICTVIGAASIGAVSTLVLAGCTPVQVGSSGGGGCTSHYERVVDAPTRAALERRLLRDVDPRTRSLRILSTEAGEEKTVVNLVSGRHRLIMSLDMWRREDGTWTAQRWSQCID
jgi:hypothetical protein